MSRFSKDFFKAALGLTLTVFLGTALQVRGATAGVINSGDLLLAQKAEQEKAKAPGTLPQKPEAPKPSVQPQPQPGQMQRKVRSMGPISDEPAKAGTKKIGGQPIRAKETPQGE